MPSLTKLGRTRFTKSFIDALATPSKKDGDTSYLHTQGNGGKALVLRLSYGGTRTWKALYYVEGKPRAKLLGHYPDMAVDEAYAAFGKFSPEKEIAATVAGTFKEVGENWLREHVDEEGLRSAKEIRRHLHTYVYPAWGHRKIFDIKRKDVNRLLDAIKNNEIKYQPEEGDSTNSKRGKRANPIGSRSQADAVLATIRGVMTWYAGQDDDYVLPLVPKMRRDKRPTSERARKRVLNDDEIRALWNVTNDLGSYGAMIKVLLLTGQRLRKVARMQWTDLVEDLWTISTERREKGNPGTIKLPSLVMAIINEQPQIAENPYVFPAIHGKGPINSFSQCKRGLDKRLREAIPNMPPWVVHDLRRTARSLMSRLGINRFLAERALGHAIAGIEGIYDRHDYGAERAEALSKLAALVEMILTPPEGTNVVAIRREALSA